MEHLAELTGAEGIWLRTDRAVAEREGLPETVSERAFGVVPDEPIAIVEHDLRYQVDLRGGQKTGRVPGKLNLGERLDVGCVTTRGSFL